MIKILQTLLLIIIFSNSASLMLGKNILHSKINRISLIVAAVDLLIIYFFSIIKESIIIYLSFSFMIVLFSLGLRYAINGSNSFNLEKNYLKNKKMGFMNIFVYLLLFFLIMLTIGVMKNILFDSKL